MRAIAMTLLGMALAGWAAHAQDAPKPAESQRVHTETSFDVTVHAPLAEAETLFTPEGERAWGGKHWDPHYAYASGPGRDGVGAVFTIQHGSMLTSWVVTARDADERHFQYVYSIAGLLITTIDVRFEPMTESATRVRVTYARTAISADGDEHVKELTEGDHRSADDWQSALDKYFASQKKQ